jgi:DNA polymerase-3 subunit beta
VLLQSNGSFNVVATDTKRLSVYKADELEDKFNLLLPEKSAKILLSALHPENDIQMVAYPKRVKIIQDNITIISNLIEGAFPDYTHIIPKDFKSYATFETKALREAVSSLKPFMDNENPRVTLNIMKDSTSLNSKENELGLGENAVESSLEGDEVKIAFNYFFLQSILDTITDENLIVNIVEPNKPALFQGSETKDHFIVTVPMKAEA